MFGQKFFPYSTLQELNLDWILTKVKNILRFVPDDGVVGQILRRTPDGAEWSNETGGGGAVDSVNGQTGTVVLTASDVGALPSSYTPPVISVNTKTGAVVLDKTDVGLGNVANVAQYSASNPPPYPVTSVNNKTGAVSLTASDVGALPSSYTPPVTSVNTKTGAVVLNKTDVGLGNVANVAQYSASNPPPYPVTSVNTKTGAVVLNKTDVGLGNVANVAQYSASNPPPYPVTSVNGMTGDVVVQGGGGSALDAYPVGSIYMSVKSTSPATLFGGTWARLKDRFLLGAGDTYSNGATGGEAQHTLTVAEMPSHTHKSRGFWQAPDSGGNNCIARNTISTDPLDTNSLANTGGGGAHNNMPPYLVVYMWKRTA